MTKPEKLNSSNQQSISTEPKNSRVALHLTDININELKQLTPSSGAVPTAQSLGTICYAPRFCMNCLLRTTFNATPDCYQLNPALLKTPEPKTYCWRCTKANQQPASMNKLTLANSTKPCAAIAREKKH